MGFGGESRVNDNSGLGVDRDAEQLKALGYVSHFDRTMSKWENFSLGFTYLSPVVGVYTIFASAFLAGEPPTRWSVVVVCDFFVWHALSLQPALPAPAARGAPPLFCQTLGMDGRMGLCLG